MFLVCNLPSSTSDYSPVIKKTIAVKIDAPPTPYIKSAWLKINFFSILFITFQLFDINKIPGFESFKQVLINFIKGTK